MTNAVFFKLGHFSFILRRLKQILQILQQYNVKMIHPVSGFEHTSFWMRVYSHYNKIMWDSRRWSCDLIPTLPSILNKTLKLIIRAFKFNCEVDNFHN